MFYCPGTNCAKKDICKHHFTEGVVQFIDWSTMGSCSAYNSETGKTIVEDGYYCGDNGNYDKFVPIHEDTIKERIDLCDNVVQPFIESSEEDLTGKMLSMTTVDEWINALGQKTMGQIHEAEKDHPTLAVYDHYIGRLEGIQMVHKFLDFARAPKVTFECDRADNPYTSYKCGNCNNEVYEDDKYCSECGVKLVDERTSYEYKSTI